MLSRRLSIVLLLVAVMMLAGCIGIYTRDQVLIPMMSASWAGVCTDAAAGGADVDILDKFTVALEEKDKPTIISLWPAIKISAETGIKDAPEGLKASKEERIRNFDEAVGKLASRLF